MLADLRVSCQHRMRIAVPLVAQMFGAPRVPVPALRLAGLPGIDTEAVDTDHVHPLLDAHEAEGAPSKNLFLRALTGATQEEIPLISDDRVMAQTPDTPIPASAGC